MAISHDAYSKMAADVRGPGNPQTHSWTHTPSGTPKGVLVWIATGPSTTNATDNMVESVTYGGVAMTKVAEVHGVGSEPGSAWMYELLSGIPTGAQTVAASVRGMPTSNSGTYPFIHGQCVTMATASGTVARQDSDSILSSSLSNPSVTMNGGANTCISYLGGFSAVGGIASITAATGCTITGSLDMVNSDDTTLVIRQTTPASGDFAIGFTAGLDDVSMVAGTYYEVAASASAKKMGPMGFFG